MPDFKGDQNSPGRQATRRSGEDGQIEPDLSAYCEYFARVIRAGFGPDKRVSATIFQERGGDLPFRLVAVHLDSPGTQTAVEPLDSPDLLSRLHELDRKLLTNSTQSSGGVFYQRVARVYDTIVLSGRRVPTVYLVKPDQMRYWTRSAALDDADQVAADIMLSPDGCGTAGEDEDLA